MIPKNKVMEGLILFSLVLMFTSSQLVAQSLSVGLFGNFNFSQTPKSFKDSFTTGIGLGGEIKYNLLNRTSLRFNWRYQSQDIKTDEDIIIHELVGGPIEGATFNVRGGEMTMSSFSTSIIHYIIKPKQLPSLYFTIGGSFHFIKTKDLCLDGTFEGQTMTVITYYAPDETVVKLGIHEGFGLEKYIQNRFSVFTEIQYTYLFTGSLTKEYIWDYNYDPDLKISYLTLFAGIHFLFLK
ncbi:hypothetical protein MUP95_06820 [bacterium]|nr:hypothetical protein [bacterium]